MDQNAEWAKIRDGLKCGMCQNAECLHRLEIQDIVDYLLNYSMKASIIIGLALLIATISSLHPTPLFQQYSGGALQLGTFCNVFHFPANQQIIDSHYYFNKIAKRLNRELQCPKALAYVQSVHTPLETTQAMQKKAEGYEIVIDETGIQIIYADYSGYVYALQTLAQLYSNGRLPHCYIKDEPVLTHRGVMIDTARHFVKISTIKRLIQNMPQSKLNILHWHLVDDESFPLKLASHPELAQYGSYSPSKIYTLEDVQGLIALAQKNGVKIIPEIDTSAHMRSWTLSPTLKTKNLTFSCSLQKKTPAYSQIVNPAKAEALRLVQDVVSQLDRIFKSSPYMHLGGNLVNYTCWKRSDIESFKKLHHINSSQGLIGYWRYEVKQVLPATRRVIYWIDESQAVPVSDKDILQFNGNSSDLVKALQNTTSKVILSPFDLFDLTTGFGNVWMNQTNSQFNSWKAIYEGFGRLLGLVDQGRLLGAELLLWGTAVNDDNLESFLWMRGAIFAERLWSAKTVPLAQLVTSALKVQRNLQGQGIDVSPLTSEFCEKWPATCWPGSSGPAGPQILAQ